MKLKKMFFSLILLTLSMIACFSPQKINFASADSGDYRVVFDYRMSDISDKLDRSVQNYVCYVHNGETVSKLVADEDVQKLSSIKMAYSLVWTVNGVGVTDVATYNITKDTTFVAKWAPRKFTITFACNGSSEYPVGENFAPFEYTIETLTNGFNIAYRYMPQREHYDFCGWYKTSSFVPSSYVFKLGVSDLGSYTLYAKWLPNEYGINYHTTGENTKNPTTYNVEDGKIALYEPSLKGHIFKGWYLDKELTVPTFEIDAGWGRVLDIYPKWELETYKVTYILPDGTRTQVSCEYGKTAELPSELKKSIFEVVKTDVSRKNIECDTRITITLVNIWWVYLLGVIAVAMVFIVIILVKSKRERRFNRLRKTYQSNASKYAKHQRRSTGFKNNRKNW